jgi:hypothetical protein
MKRVAKCLRCTVGIFLGFLLIAAGMIYFVATSDHLRGQLEGRASDLNRRKTQIAKVVPVRASSSNCSRLPECAHPGLNERLPRTRRAPI